MILRTSTIRWAGTSKDGGVKLIRDSPPLGDESAEATPEKLLTTALAASYGMALACSLEDVGASPDRLDIRANMVMANEPTPIFSEILLQIVGEVPLIDEAAFIRLARKAKDDCAMCRALAGVEIRLEAVLSSSPQ